MKTSTQLRIDRHFVGFLNLANWLARILGRLLRMDHSLDRDFATLAVCKYKGLGSIIQATPLLLSLRRRYPNARIIFITTPPNGAILERIPVVDEALYVDDSSAKRLLATLLTLLWKLTRLQVDVFLDLEVYSNFSSLVSLLSLSRNRIGFYLPSSPYRIGIYTHMMYYNTRASIAQTYLQMARLLGCRDIAEEPRILGADLTAVSIEGHPFVFSSERYFVVNVNASDLRLERRWGRPNFVRLIRLLREAYPDHKILLVGNVKEKPYVDSIVEEVGNGTDVSSIAGKTTLKELLAVIQHARIAITNDTGPMHMALALGTKTIALLGPCTPFQYADSDHAYVIYKNLYCSPCVHEFPAPPCRGDNQCMKGIEVQEVIEGVACLLQHRTRSNPAMPPMAFTAPDNKVLGSVETGH